MENQAYSRLLILHEVLLFSVNYTVFSHNWTYFFNSMAPIGPSGPMRYLWKTKAILIYGYFMKIYFLLIGKNYQIYFFCQSVGFLDDDSVQRPFGHIGMYAKMTEILTILYFMKLRIPLRDYNRSITWLHTEPIGF